MIGTNANDILARTLEHGAYEVRGRAADHLALDGHPDLVEFRAPAVRGLRARCREPRAGSWRASSSRAASISIAPRPRDAIRARVRCRGRRRARGHGRDRPDPCARPATSSIRTAPIGIRAARTLLRQDPHTPVVALATAHPAKFPDAVAKATAGVRPDLPPHLADLMDRQETLHARCQRSGGGRDLHPRARPHRQGSVTAHEPAFRHARRLARSQDHQARQRRHGGHRGDAGRGDRDARRLGRRRLAPRARRRARPVATSSSTWPSRARRRRSARRIAEDIENVGGDINAATSAECTSYTARVLGEDVGVALDVLGDILTEFGLRCRRARAREERDPAGIRRDRGYAGRRRLRRLHRGGLSGPADRPADPRHARDDQQLRPRRRSEAYIAREYTPGPHGARGRRRRRPRPDRRIAPQRYFGGI